VFYLEDDILKLKDSLKEEHYDYIIDLHKNLRTQRLRRMLGVKSFSFNKLNLAKWLMVNFKIDLLPPKHIVDRYMEAVSSLGVINDGKGLEYFITAKDAEAVERLPREFIEPGYIAFAIGARHKTKQMPPEKIASICAQLDRQIILLGGQEDFAKGEYIAEQVENIIRNQKTHSNANANFPGSDHVFNACGKYSLNESAAIVKFAEAVITHDTGLMHIAAAYHKKIVSVWGNTIPEFGMNPYFGNFPALQLTSEVKGLSCRPCSKLGFGKCPKGHFKCMKNIDEQKIVRFVQT
jgi:ADP-heptose:LPS heptosyltransferase